MNRGEARYAYRRARVILVDKERRPCQVGGCGDKATTKIGGLAVCRSCATRIFDAYGDRIVRGEPVSRQELLRAAKAGGEQ